VISFARLSLILLLLYFVKCRSRSLAVFHNEFTLGKSVAHPSAQKIIARSQHYWKSL